MISKGENASGKPAEVQAQEIFKLKMERDAFKAQYDKKVKECDKLTASNAELQLGNEHKDLVILNALELIKKFQLELFGKSSERIKSLDAYCQNLFDEVELLDRVEKQNQEDPLQQDDSDNDTTDEPETTPKVRKAHKEQDLTTLPANTPVIDVDHTADCVAPIDPNTGKKMVQIGTKTERKVGREHRVVIYNHIFPVFGPEEGYEAEDGENNTVVVYPQTERILKGSMISNEILAEVITKKYLDHMPLYRLEQHFNRMGIPISRQNMKNWLFSMSEKCGPLIELLRESLLSSPIIKNPYLHSVDMNRQYTA